MSWAERMGHIARNPIAAMEKPSQGRRETIVRADEFEAILHRYSDEAFRDLLVVAWETGARPQEILHVEARHVDIEQSRWVFPKSESKVKKRQRVVYLAERVLEITKRRMQTWPEGKLFRDRNGEPWDRNAIACRFRRLEPHIGKRLCRYHFRHSYSTRMLEAGVDSLVVAALMGHARASAHSG